MFVHDVMEHIKYIDVVLDQRQSWNRVAHWLAKMVEDNRSGSEKAGRCLVELADIKPGSSPWHCHMNRRPSHYGSKGTSVIMAMFLLWIFRLRCCP